MSNRLDKEREEKLQPVRIEFAISEIEKLGIKIEQRNETTIKFYFNNYLITFFPYSGWHTGRGIKDGRGLHKLLKQLKQKLSERRGGGEDVDEFYTEDFNS